MRKLFEKHKKELLQIGEIIIVFNSIENIMVAYLSSIFASHYDSSERLILMNDALCDVSIFETFNQKINFLEKAIKRVARIATEKGETFNERKYLDICKSIRDIQKYRNKIAHMLLVISREGKAIIYKRKTDIQFLIDKKGSLRKEEIDLNSIVNQVLIVYDKAFEILFKEGAPSALNILLKE